MSRLNLSLLLALVIAAAAAVASYGATEPSHRPAARAPARPVDPITLAGLERRENARIGVFALDTGSGRVVQHRADERFPFASTVKALAAGVVLRRASAAELTRVVDIQRDDLVQYSPVTDAYVGMGLGLQHLVNAAMQWSDNAAANLIVEQLGGTARFERELRALGDRVTSIDRLEPDLNEALPGDERDTTTPRAIAGDLRRLLIGNALTPRRRELLRSMMLANTTGDKAIRAGVPASWKVGDKTGTAGYGTRNDIAVAWPRRGKPIVLAVYTTHTSADAAPDDALVAEATRIAIRALRR
jgi:beta-lactamase class A